MKSNNILRKVSRSLLCAVLLYGGLYSNSTFSESLRLTFKNTGSVYSLKLNSCQDYPDRVCGIENPERSLSGESELKSETFSHAGQKNVESRQDSRNQNLIPQNQSTKGQEEHKEQSQDEEQLKKEILVQAQKILEQRSDKIILEAHPELQSTSSMSDALCREWYHAYIDESVPFVEGLESTGLFSKKMLAEIAFELRHAARMGSRARMDSWTSLKMIEIRDWWKYSSTEGPDFNYLFNKEKNKGKTDSESYDAILDSFKRTSSFFDSLNEAGAKEVTLNPELEKIIRHYKVAPAA